MTCDVTLCLYQTPCDECDEQADVRLWCSVSERKRDLFGLFCLHHAREFADRLKTNIDHVLRGGVM